MNKTEYTPGPWKQATRGPNGCPIIGAGRTMVAMLAHSTNHDNQAEQAEANARLIAAAPDLIESLKEASDELESLMRVRPKYKGGQNILARCRAAIAKATGGAE